MELLIAIIVLVPLAFATGVVFIVRQQNVAIIERFGKFVGVAQAGLNFKFPAPISLIATHVNLRISQTVHELGIKTKDNAFVKIPVKVQLRVLPDRVVDSYYKLNNPEVQINSFILNLIRSKGASLDLEEVYTKRSDLADFVMKELEQKVADYGFEIVDVLVDEPEPSREVQNSYNSVLASKRDLEAARNKAEAKKALLIGEAEAEAKSLELKAESYAVQRKVITKGIADALHEIQDKELGSRYILEFLASLDYRDTIRDAAKSDSNTLVFSNNPREDLQKLTPLLARRAHDSGSFRVNDSDNNDLGFEEKHFEEDFQEGSHPQENDYDPQPPRSPWGDFKI
ncbi:MAG: SPFH domain-containing protein [Rickettsiales bacterium]|nr:SPFH domain-containing protein [Rickettsiales bacterium]